MKTFKVPFVDLKIGIGCYSKEPCWKYKFELAKYWNKKIWIFSFYRFYVDLDFRKNWLEDMITGGK